LLLAFDELVAGGWLETRPRSATFVAGSPPLEAPLAGAPSARGVGSPGVLSDEPRSGELGGFPIRVWSDLVARHARRLEAVGSRPSDPLGEPELRAALAAHHRILRGVACEAGQVVVTDGAQQALTLAALALVGAGGAAGIEAPGIARIDEALTLLGARAVPFVAETIASATGRERSGPCCARALFVRAGARRSAGQRDQLLDCARRLGASIVECDVDSVALLQPNPEPLLQSSVSACPIAFAGSLGDLAPPACTLGFLVLPPAQVPAFESAARALGIAVDLAIQRAFAELLVQGHVARRLRRLRTSRPLRLGSARADAAAPD
jgi:GntR family transcriptional regulator/MocR family aminotransferase